MSFPNAAQKEIQFLKIDRFREVVVRPLAHRRHGSFDGSERGHHDHRHLGVRTADFFDQIEAGEVRHLEIRQDEIHLVGIQLIQRLPDRGCFQDGVLLLAQVAGQNITLRLLIVRDQDAKVLHGNGKVQRELSIFKEGGAFTPFPAPPVILHLASFEGNLYRY